MAEKGTAWSIKGINEATREIARDGAKAADTTIGAWIDQAIRDHAQGRSAASGRGESRALQSAPSQSVDAGALVDMLELTLDRSHERIDEALRPMGLRLIDLATRLVAAERQAVSFDGPLIEAERTPRPEPLSPPEPPREDFEREVSAEDMPRPPLGVTPSEVARAPSEPAASDGLNARLAMLTAELERRAEAAEDPEQADEVSGDPPQPASEPAPEPAAPRIDPTPSSMPAPMPEPVREITLVQGTGLVSWMRWVLGVALLLLFLGGVGAFLMADQIGLGTRKAEIMARLPGQVTAIRDSLMHATEDLRRKWLGAKTDEPSNPPSTANTRASNVDSAESEEAPTPARRTPGVESEGKGEVAASAPNVVQAPPLKVQAPITPAPITPAPITPAPVAPAPIAPVPMAEPEVPAQTPVAPPAEQSPPVEPEGDAASPQVPASSDNATAPSAGTSASTPKAAEPVSSPAQQPAAGKPSTSDVVPATREQVAVVPTVPSAPSLKTKDAPAPARKSGPEYRAWLEAQAARGDGKAQHDLGVLSAKATDGRDPDYAAAAKWFREAAIQGIANAQYNLGVLYERGLGVEPDNVRALLWYHSAAEQDHPLAQYNLGVFYAEGRGVPPNVNEALIWFKAAAARGVAKAYFNWAVMVEDGLVGPPDAVRARELYTKAAELADEQAIERLKGYGVTVEPKAKAPGPATPLAGTAGTDVKTSGNGSGPSLVAAIQERLLRMGLYVGRVDGVSGPMTRGAVREYERLHGLPVTGVVSQALLDHMGGGS